MGEISLSIAREPAQWDQKLPQDDPWRFFCLAMTLMLLLLVLILGAVPAEESSCEPCPKTWLAFQDSCYEFSTYELTWLKVKDHCAKEGAHLVITNSQVEQEFMSTEEDVRYWVGLRKQSSNDIYKWQDGSAPTFINWSSERPNPYHCVFMKKSCYWTPVFCDAYEYMCSICEKPQIC